MFLFNYRISSDCNCRHLQGGGGLGEAQCGLKQKRSNEQIFPYFVHLVYLFRLHHKQQNTGTVQHLLITEP